MNARRSPARLFSLLVVLSLITWTGCSLKSNPANNSSGNSSGNSGVGQLAANPTSLQFGLNATNSTKTLSQTLNNVGSAALTISQISATGAGYSFSGINPPVTLSPGQAATFSVEFAPQSSGAATGSLSVASNASNSTLSIALSGTGSSPGQLGVSPATVNFGNVVVGNSQSQTAALSASSGPVTVSSATMSGSEFSLSGLSLPLTIAVGTSVPFTLTFSPQASGSTSGTLTFTGSASNSGLVQTLTGTGTSATQRSVSLNWTASTSSNVTYNVYRGTTTGGPYPTQIDSGLPGTTATDSTVVSGQTYYYVVTAENSNGESGYSNQATAVIP